MKGEVVSAEWTEQRDRKSGLRVKQLTNYKAHSHHLYFTNTGWYDGGRKLLFGSDRCDETHLFSLDLQSGAITQLTEYSLPDESGFLFTCVSPTRDEAYFWRGNVLVALDLNTLQERPLDEVPPGWSTNMLNCSADGKYVCTGIYEDLSHRFDVDLLHGYVGFREYWEAHPLSRVLRIATDGSGADVVFEENYWIGHVNTSPTQPHILSFCHEGPWDKVDQRIWGCDMNTGKVWKILPTKQGDRVGHEYWLADGETIGYHGHIGGQPVFGFVRYDNSEHTEAVMQADSVHFHSNNRNLIVGDGTGSHPYVLLWRWQGETIEEPRIVCEHRSSFHIQQTHVHPRFSPNGKQILFTSDRSGYGNVFLVDVPPYDELPPLGT